MCSPAAAKGRPASEERSGSREGFTGRTGFVGLKNMTKIELAAKVADKVHLTGRQAEAAVNILLTSIAEALREGGKVELRGFGSFRRRSRNARQGRNPRTGDAVQVPAKKVPVFRPGQELREKVGPVQDR